jgi:hypothetical protein
MFHPNLPIEMTHKILFELPVLEILDMCTTNSYINDICNDDEFWIAYITNKHNIDELISDADMEKKGYINKLKYLLWETENTTKGFKMLALYMEEFKIITMFMFSLLNNKIEPFHAIPRFVSGYDNIHDYLNIFEGQTVLHGTDISILRNDEDKIVVIPMSDKFGPISETVVIDESTLFRDINFPGGNILKYITNCLVKVVD